MNRFFIDKRYIPSDLRQGLALIRKLHADRFTQSTSNGSVKAHAIHFEISTSQPHGYKVTHHPQAKRIVIQYTRPCDAFHALGRIMGQPSPSQLNLAETSQFDTVGLMLDVSRNGVMHTGNRAHLMFFVCGRC